MLKAQALLGADECVTTLRWSVFGESGVGCCLHNQGGDCKFGGRIS